MEFGNKTWSNIEFSNLLGNAKTNRIIGLTFPKQDTNLGLEPSVLTVLPEGDNVEYCCENILFNDSSIEMYLCSVYITGYDEFKRWAMQHDFNKIVVGGYHPTSFPEDFIRYAAKIVQGPCDNIMETIKQSGQVVKGITTNSKIPRYDLYNVGLNQQIIPDKKPEDICTSINTSQGCPFKCDFCCSPIMCPDLVSKPIGSVRQEVEYLKTLKPKFIFIRDENFPLQRDWRQRLDIISEIGAKIYLFASANLLSTDNIGYMASRGVYMVCLGLEDITVDYGKNKDLDRVCRELGEHGIYRYLSFIVDPLKIVGREKGEQFYKKLMQRFFELGPEMVCGNFLMPFRGTKLWDKYYHLVSPEDYSQYDSKSAFLIKNPIVREKMEFFMFWYQYLYYTSDFYNENVRKFHCGDTLDMRFDELYKEFMVRYDRVWNVRA